MFGKNLIVQASNKCPCYCQGCYNYFSSTEISTEKLVKFVLTYKDKFDLKKVTISGGDPLLRTDIVPIIELLLREGLYVSVDSVGLELTKGKHLLIESLKKIHLLGLPVDGCSSDSINVFRYGLSFESLNKAIHVANGAGIPICVNTVVHAQNIDEMLKIAEYIDSFENIIKWQLFQYMPIGPRGKKNSSFFAISEESFLLLQEELEQYSFRHSIDVECKSLSCRKNRYILLGADGVLWYPYQSNDNTWNYAVDSNSERIIIGHIEEPFIFEKIRRVFTI